jgi:hypothetical protein
MNTRAHLVQWFKHEKVRWRWSVALTAVALASFPGCNPSRNPPTASPSLPPPTPTPYWRPAERLSGAEADSAVVSTGGWVAWRQTSGATRAAPHHIWARRFDGSAWTPAERLSRTGRARHLDLSSLGPTWSVAVWEEDPGSGHPVIQASFWDAVSRHWSEPATISDPQADASQPAVASLFEGPRAAWVQKAADGTSSVWSARLATFPAGWEAPARIGSPTAGRIERPRLAVSGADIFAVWIQDDHVYSNRLAGGAPGWDGARPFPQDSDRATSAAVAADESGNAVAIWVEWSLGSVLKASLFDKRAGGWIAPTEPETYDLNIPEHPSLVFVGQDCVGAWDIDSNPWLESNRFRRGVGWASQPTVIWVSPTFRRSSSGLADTGQPAFVRLTAFRSGALAVWQADRDLYSAAYDPSLGWRTAELIGETLTPQTRIDASRDLEPELVGTASVAGASLGLFQPSVGIVAWARPVSRETRGMEIWARTYR